MIPDDYHFDMDELRDPSITLYHKIISIETIAENFSDLVKMWNDGERSYEDIPGYHCQPKLQVPDFNTDFLLEKLIYGDTNLMFSGYFNNGAIDRALSGGQSIKESYDAFLNKGSWNLHNFWRFINSGEHRTAVSTYRGELLPLIDLELPVEVVMGQAERVDGALRTIQH